MSKPPSTARPWVLRSDLRLVLVTGLGAGFGLLSPMGFGYYIPLTTAAVLTSSYGNSLNLSIQRMLGSVLGVVVLMIFSRDLQMPWRWHSDWLWQRYDSWEGRSVYRLARRWPAIS